MRIALIADTFPPLRTSGAVQLRDLSREFVSQGHALTVMLPAAGLTQPWELEQMDGVQVLRLRAPRTKDIGYVRRTIGEFMMPFAMRRQLRRSPLASQRWDGVVWYALIDADNPVSRTLVLPTLVDMVDGGDTGVLENGWYVPLTSGVTRTCAGRPRSPTLRSFIESYSDTGIRTVLDLDKDEIVEVICTN